MKYANLLKQAQSYYLLSTADRVYGPYDRGDGRKLVIIRKDDGTSRTVSYPKYIMEQHLKRELDPELETVDHWDSDFNNNDISNLRLVPRKEHSADDTRRVKMVKLKCALCNKEFERSPRVVRDKARKGKVGPFCSRKCAGIYSRKLQLKLIDKLDTQPIIDSEYYKKKYVNASIDGHNYLNKILLDYCLDIYDPNEGVAI